MAAAAAVRRAAIVTGGSRGIGRALAEVLVEEGYAITLVARRGDHLAAVAEAFEGGGAEVHSVALDLADPVAIGEAVASHDERFGRLDVLINSAGVGTHTPVLEQTTRQIDLQFAVNLQPVIESYRAAADLLASAGNEHGSALVVNLASLAGKVGHAGLAVYGATKAAVIGYTEAMNREWQGTGVKSVALCPGFVDTDMTEFIREQIGPENLIETADLQHALRFLLRLSPACEVPEIIFRHGTANGGG